MLSRRSRRKETKRLRKIKPQFPPKNISKKKKNTLATICFHLSHGVVATYVTALHLFLKTALILIPFPEATTKN